MPVDPPAGLKPGALIAVTGATGFLGRHLIPALLEAGFAVKALTRRPQGVIDGVQWVEGDLNDRFALASLVQDTDGLVHAAALTMAQRRHDFLTVNVGGTAGLALGAAVQKAPVQRSVLISSLAARRPNLSAYARSKRAAESIWQGLPAEMGPVILRPPAIYGPGDPHVLQMVQAARNGWLPCPAGLKARFSMIHVSDMAAAIIAALSADTVPDQPLELSDPVADGYSMGDIADMVSGQTGKTVRTVPIPRWFVRLVGLGHEFGGLLCGKPVFFSAGKAWEVTQRDWVSQPSGNKALNPWSPKLDFLSGLSTLTAEEDSGART